MTKLKTSASETSENLIIEDSRHKVTLTKQKGFYPYLIEWFYKKNNGTLLKIEGMVHTDINRAYGMVAAKCRTYDLRYKRKLNKWYDSQ